MLSNKQIQALRSENELLQIQLEDVTLMIQVREEELALLRNRAREAAGMQSKLDSNLDEFDQMQRSMGDIQQKNTGSLQRIEEMEHELYDAIKEQLQYADSLKKFGSMEANLHDTNNELQEASAVYMKMAAMKITLAESKSNLEIARMEVKSLKQELAEVKAYNELLIKKRLQ